MKISRITKKNCGNGKIMEITCVDHLIIAGETYTSFVEKRLFLK